MDLIDLKSQYLKIEADVMRGLNKVLEHGQYIHGPEVRELEKVLGDFCNVKNVIACANGTDALSIAMRALDIQPGDEIITTPFTFFATAETAAMLGAKIVFVDINPDTYNIDPQKIEDKITSKTKCIIPVSLYGQCASLDIIQEIGDKYNIAVIEDGAQSFGGTISDGRKSCSINTISTTSFFPSKPLGCYGDGGALFTNNKELGTKARQIANHGQVARYDHAYLGYNSRLDSVQAAILLEKIKIFPQEIVARNIIANRYSELLGPEIKKQKVLKGYTSVYAQYTIEVDNRDQFISKMKGLGVPTAVHYPIPLHFQRAMKDQGYKEGDFPLSEMAAKRVVSLPMHPYMTEETQKKVVQAVKKSLENK